MISRGPSDPTPNAAVFAAAAPAVFAAPLLPLPTVLVFLVLAGARPTRGFALALEAAPPRDEAAGVFALLTGGGAGLRTLEIDAAVGLLRRSADVLLSVGFLIGVGSGGAALRALARDAAVGANNPDPEEGVFGRDVLAGVDPGVFGRAIELGVFARLGVA